jgi:uncharacterized protein (DUF427 family)
MLGSTVAQEHNSTNVIAISLFFSTSTTKQCPFVGRGKAYTIPGSSWKEQDMLWIFVFNTMMDAQIM